MTLTGRRVLVAGGTGLVGANLTKRLAALGAEVLASSYSRQPEGVPGHYERFDFTELDQCVAATKGQDDVFICAAQTFGAKIMQDNPTALVLPNLRINSGLLEACRLNKVERVVFISSSTVYQEAEYPIREDELDLNKPPYELYLGVGWMKRYIEQLANFYAVRHGMRIGIVRPTNIYGPHDKFDEEKSHVLPALIKRALQKQHPFVVWGDGTTIRDFLYVEDFVEDLLEILERQCVCTPVNVANGKTITIREAVEVILDICGHHVTPTYDPSKPTAIPVRRLHTARFESLVGPRTRTPFREGIRKTVEWYRAVLSHGEAARSTLAGARP